MGARPETLVEDPWGLYTGSNPLPILREPGPGSINIVIYFEPEIYPLRSELILF